MTNHFAMNDKAGYSHTHRHLLLTLLLTKIRKLLGFVYQNKASINAIQYVIPFNV